VIPADAELIARTLADDDRAAFGALVLRHQSSVRNFLRHLARGDAALADDLAQETFVRAYRGLARFRGDANFSTWLLGIAHNHWRNTTWPRPSGSFLPMSNSRCISATSRACRTAKSPRSLTGRSAR